MKISLINFFQSGKKYIFAHKIISGIAVVFIIGVAWWAYGSLTSTSGQVRYVLGAVAQNTVVASVSESGQVTASDVLNITPQASGQIIGVYVTPGKKINAGQAIATIDPTTELQAVQSAKESLQSAQISLQLLQEPAAQLTVTQQQNAITQAQQSLTTQYLTSGSDITNTFLDLPSIMSGLQDVDLGSETNSSSQWNIDYYENQAAQYNPSAQSYRDAAYTSYIAARNAYNKTFDDFKSAPSTPTSAQTEVLLTETYNTTQLIATAVKSANNLILFYQDQLTQNNITPKAVSTTQLATLNSYTGKVMSHLNALLSDTNTLANDKSGITEKQQTLAQTQAGADPLSVQSSQLNVTKAQEALSQAQTNLAHCYVTAPFAGIIASVPVNKYDQAGSGTTLATLITDQQYTDLSLNEVDAAKIQLGNNVTITFNAIPNLTLTGTVAQMNPVGTVAQGVVTYDVKVGFSTQDSRVKTGMSVNANIQTAVAQDVLTVPASAIKTSVNGSYVLAFTPPLPSPTLGTGATSTASSAALGVISATPPQQVPVTVGISDNTNTQILTGLTLGEQIVTRTVSGSSAATAATAATSRTTGAGGGFGGGGGGGGSAIRL